MQGFKISSEARSHSDKLIGRAVRAAEGPGGALGQLQAVPLSQQHCQAFRFSLMGPGQRLPALPTSFSLRPPSYPLSPPPPPTPCLVLPLSAFCNVPRSPEGLDTWGPFLGIKSNYLCQVGAFLWLHEARGVSSTATHRRAYA